MLGMSQGRSLGWEGRRDVGGRDDQRAELAGCMAYRLCGRGRQRGVRKGYLQQVER